MTQNPSNDVPADVVVTAQKRSASINTVPISITAASQAMLDAQGLKNIDDLSRTVPGLAISKSGTVDDQISIRGILSTVGASTTGVYIDETPVAARNICFYCGFTAYPQLFDLERVEVLRGPQGTLFGAGSMGGTIRFITPAPSLVSYSGYARGEMATTRFGEPTFEAGAAAGGPIVADTIGFRASLWTRQEGGYIDQVDRETGQVKKRDANSRQSYVGRLAVTIKPTDALTITPSIFYQRLHLDDRDSFWLDAGQFRNWTPQLQPVTDRQIVSAVDISYDAGPVTLRSITSYYDRVQRRLDDYTYSDLAYDAGVTDPSTIPGYVSSNFQNTYQKDWTQELRASSNGSGPFSVTGGLYYARSKTSFSQRSVSDFDYFTQTFFGGTAQQVFGFPLVNGAVYLEDDIQTDREYAVFGEASYEVVHGLKATAGARVSHNEFDLTIARTSVFSGVSPALDRKGKATPFTPRASLSYETGRWLFYGTIAKGFRIGGGNTSLAGVPSCTADLQSLGYRDVPGSYGSDSLWSREVGAKRSFAGGRGRLAASAYWIDWKNIQTNIILPTCGYNYTANVGKARIRGFDLEGSFKPLSGLTLNGTVAYTDAVNLDSVIVNGVTLISAGSSLAVPAWTATAGAEYGHSIGTKKEAYFRGDYQYAAHYEISTPAESGYDPDTFVVGKREFVSVRSGVRLDGLDLSVFVNNLLDARPSLARGHELRGFGNLRDVTLRPRTIGVTAALRY